MQRPSKGGKTLTPVGRCRTLRSGRNGGAGSGAAPRPGRAAKPVARLSLLFGPGSGLAPVVFAPRFAEDRGGHKQGGRIEKCTEYVFQGFNDPVEVAAIGEPTDVETADFDPGGQGTGNDIAVTELGDAPEDPGQLVVLYNQDGSGENFTGLGWPVGREPSGVAIADFDGADGPDAAVCNAGDNNVTILMNDGTGQFLTFPSVEVGLNPSAIVTADLDGDTFPDLAVANRDDNTIMILRNVGPGVFELMIPPIDVGNQPSALAAGDFDGNGWPDLAVANEADRTVMIFLNDGQRGFYLADTVPVGFDPGVLEPEDLDDDDHIDLVIANRGLGTITVLYEYVLHHWKQIYLTVGDDPSSIDTADLDSDGDKDIMVVAGAGEQRAVRIFRNDLAETNEFDFTPVADLAEDPNLKLTAAEDLDGNMLPDIIAVSGPGEEPPAPRGGRQEGEVRVLLNAGGRTCPADFDFDGDVDTADLLILLAQWGTDGSNGGDVNGDGEVDTEDLLELLAAWGPCA